jgi:hypothetical protein
MLLFALNNKSRRDNSSYCNNNNYKPRLQLEQNPISRPELINSSKFAPRELQAIGKEAPQLDRPSEAMSSGRIS